METLRIPYAQSLHSLRRNVVAGLDPAFGGSDSAILQFGSIIPIGGITCICSHEPIEIPFPAGTITVHKYLAERVIEFLKRWNVSAEHLAIDTTTEGQAIWERILESHGKAISSDSAKASSDAQMFAFDEMTGHEKYADRATELWAITRAFLTCGQLRYVPPITANEFVKRKYRQLGGKLALESKSDYRLRIGKSPDRADAFSLMCAAAKEGFGLMPGEHMKAAIDEECDWNTLANKYAK
jgi:hypothetical protein